jgi:hypothetical protein
MFACNTNYFTSDKRGKKRALHANLMSRNYTTNNSCVIERHGMLCHYGDFSDDTVMEQNNVMEDG